MLIQVALQLSVFVIIKILLKDSGKAGCLDKFEHVRIVRHCVTCVHGLKPASEPPSKVGTAKVGTGSGPAILRSCLTQRGAKNKIGGPWPGSRELKSRVIFITSSRAAITVKRSSTREIDPICQGFINTQNISATAETSTDF